jgi:HEAT repeat protein
MPDIDALGSKLKSSDAEERREAVVALGHAGSVAVPHLVRALSDSDWRVRKTAVEALVTVGGAVVITGLLQQLSSHDNAGARNSAIEALVQIGAEAVDALLALLEMPDPDVRKFIVDILGEIRDPRAVQALIMRLEDPDENIRVASAEALGKIKDRRAVDALLGCLSRSGEGWLDYAAAEALGAIGDERALGPLLAALGRSSLREPVLEALGRIGSVDTLSPIIAGLADPLRIVREVSMTALTTLYRKSPPAERGKMIQSVRAGVSERAVEFLEEMLVANGGELHKVAIAVLGWAGKRNSIHKLLALLQEEDMEESIVQALKTIDGDAVPLLFGYLEDENALVRRSVARVLGDAGRSEAEGPLIGLLSDENGHVRSTAAEALGRLRSRKAVPALLDRLADEYENVQESAIRALAEIGDESVLDSLVKDFTTRDAPMRRNIALLLGKFSSSKAADALAFALKDEEADVRKAVVQALGNLPGDRAHRLLMLAVADDEPEVRMLAAEAFGKLRRPDAIDALFSLIGDPDLWVRAAATRGLGMIGGERVRTGLAAHLDSAADIFLLALIEVLGRLHAEEALAPLLRLSDYADPEVRKTVLAALAGYRWEAVQQTVLGRLSDPHWSVRKAAIEILKIKKDAAARPYLERIAESDQDETVRRAAKEALE